MDVQELLEREYGIRTTYNVNPEVDQIQVAKTRILSYNPRRVSFVLINLGAVFVSVSPDASVSLTRGIYLVPNGGTLSMVWSEDFELPAMEWYGMANGAAADIYVLEVVAQ